jgi:CHRD domain-containing protein
MDVRMKVSAVVAGAAVIGLTAVAAASAGGGDEPMRFRASLSGYAEVPPISTTGYGRFRASVTEDGIAWRLRYDALEGGAVQQAHVHFGQRRVNGGVSAFLCSNLPGAPAGVQPCPPPPADISGTITAASVVGPAAQGIAPGEAEELLRAMRAGLTYANVHTASYPNGEIRGQIVPRP